MASEHTMSNHQNTYAKMHSADIICVRACTNMRAHKRSGNQLGVAGATSLASTLPTLTGLQTLLLRRESRVCVRERESV